MNEIFRCFPSFYMMTLSAAVSMAARAATLRVISRSSESKLQLSSRALS